VIFIHESVVSRLWKCRQK